MNNDVEFYVNEFIEDMIKSGENFKDSNEISVGFDSGWLKVDPNLSALKEKLFELGFSLSDMQPDGLWTITKIK